MDATTAVVAHGLLNAVHVVRSVPSLLEGSTPEERSRLCSMLSHQLAFLGDSLDDFGDVASDELRQVLHRATVAGQHVADVCSEGLPPGTGDALQALADAAERAAAHLTGLIRGLPPDVIEYLDSLAPA
jgi:hypothetical protein